MTVATPQPMFEDVPVIGSLPPHSVESKLRSMGDPETADEIAEKAAEGGGAALFGLGGLKPWQYTTHQFGYIAPSAPGASAPLPILSASNMASDATLQNKRINVHLQRLRVVDYPGGGMHHILLTFKAQNQVPNAPEPVSFSQTYRVQQGQAAGIAGYPIFIGLNVGSLGASFQCFTVNVKNDQDQAILGFLDSAPFQAGLNLLNTSQPALAPFTGLTVGLAKAFAQRNNNAAVQDFYLGLDFQSGGLGARLTEGDYLAVQVRDENSIDWKDWVLNPNTGAVQNKANSTSTLPYNYVAFHISRYEE